MTWVGAISAQTTTLNLNLPSRHGVGMVMVEVTPGQDDDVPTSLGIWRAYGPCYGIAMVTWRHSAHPGGDLGGRLNQDNGGAGGLCYTNPEKTNYWLITGIENSQYGDSLVIAFGKRWALLSLDTQFLDRLHIPIREAKLYVGAEGGGLYYARRLGRGADWGPFIFPHIALGIQMGKNVEITFKQVFLPDRIKLWGHVLDLPPELSGNQELYPSRQVDHLNVFDHRTRPRPMLFVNVRF